MSIYLCALPYYGLLDLLSINHILMPWINSLLLLLLDYRGMLAMIGFNHKTIYPNQLIHKIYQYISPQHNHNPNHQAQYLDRCSGVPLLLDPSKTQKQNGPWSPPPYGCLKINCVLLFYMIRQLLPSLFVTPMNRTSYHSSKKTYYFLFYKPC